METPHNHTPRTECLTEVAAPEKNINRPWQRRGRASFLVAERPALPLQASLVEFGPETKGLFDRCTGAQRRTSS